MASTRRTSPSSTEQPVKHHKKPQTLHSQSDSCLVASTKRLHKVKGILTNSQHYNMKTGLPNCHDRNSTGFSNTRRHTQKINSSSSLDHNIKCNSSKSQYHALVQQHNYALPELSLHTASSNLHLRLNTSKDLRTLRVDGSPFEVT